MRKIIHIDMDAFFASVEQRDDPSLLGKPVIVGGKPERRGVVAACSYEARQFGIHSAMSSSRALKLCPDAIFLPPRFAAYRECSQQVKAIFAEFTDLIEPLSLDEAYLDVSDAACYAPHHQGSATLLAQDIKQCIQQQVGLTASAGVSYNKFLAKIASDMDKPDGLYVIRPEQAQAFIESLAVRKFFGVGKVTEAKMHKLNIFTGKDLKPYSKAELVRYFGRVGEHYYQVVRGVDDRPVKVSRQRKSIGKETTFSHDVLDKSQIWQTLQGLSDSVVAVLERQQLMAKTLTLKVKYHDFKQITRSITVTQNLQSVADVCALLPELLLKTQVGVVPIRLIGVSVSSLSSATQALDGQQESKSQLLLFKS